ncbi:hypothetical protein FB567DRAFT_587984 [Paraphoma chrysanthemicola]|uniref:Uncharacterized protein n=1 Tax=Paraphoma chrysanthemicola TaxID=798071 RepID=A0A8K0RFH4_9PLEO|nr:hypothetical protein FB567DRAFT_587984 [Paraphoma chrysanthemicola]
MAPTTLRELNRSLSPPLEEPDEDATDAEIAQADSIVRSNLAITFQLVPNDIVRTSNIRFIYFDQRHTKFPTVPVDLQLEWYLENYVAMAQEGFVAKQEGQNPKITRAIWFYGVDDHHSFSRQKRAVRANLLGMAYVMANKFPRTICNPETERFVLAFVGAWMSDLIDTGKLETQSFAAREDFVEL